VGGTGPERSSHMQVRGEGLTLREWVDPDVASMVRRFNTSEMDRWTPLAHPFDETVAGDYVQRARDARAAGTPLSWRSGFPPVTW
jgi:hypothetical protein